MDLFFFFFFFRTSSARAVCLSHLDCSTRMSHSFLNLDVLQGRPSFLEM